MRMLFISNFYPPKFVGGYELNCHDVAQALIARGHRVHVLTSTYKVKEMAGVEKGVSRRLWLRKGWPNPPSARRLAGMWGNWAMQQHNVRVVRRVIARFQPDVVTMWNGAHMGGALLSATEQCAETVYFLEDNWLAHILVVQRHRAKTPARTRLLYSLAYGGVSVPADAVRNDRLIFNSQALREGYWHWGAGAPYGTVIHLGIPTDIFVPHPPRILRRDPSEPLRVLYTGQLLPSKGVGTLISAFGKLRAMPGLEQTRLSLMGNVWSAAYDVELRDRIASLGLQNAVDFLPVRPRSEVPAVLAEHDVLAFTTELLEPFALTLLEAMAVGLPVVSTLRGGSGEVVRDGENALAFHAGEPDDLTQKLAWVLTHPNEAAAMGTRASEQVRRHYTLDAQVCSLESYLQDVVAKRR
jgi:glycogen synthase